MSDREEHTPPPQDENGRLAVLEAAIREIKGRLGEGAESFAELRDAFNIANAATSMALGEVETRWSGKFEVVIAAVEAVKPKPKEIPWLAIAGLVIAIAGPILLLTWNAAHYPERAEFTEVQRRANKLETSDELSQERQKNLDDALGEIRKSLGELKTSMDRIEAAPRRPR